MAMEESVGLGSRCLCILSLHEDKKLGSTLSFFTVLYKLLVLLTYSGLVSLKLGYDNPGLVQNVNSDRKV